jgi:hypothetical protein
MKIPQKLGVTAIILFIISHFLPACVNVTGFGCFQKCWEILVRPTANFDLGWFYYSGFVFSNILFLALAVALFTTKKSLRFRMFTSLILLFHVMSWYILHLFDKTMGIFEIKVGYYVWLLAYALLFVTHTTKSPTDAKTTP